MKHFSKGNILEIYQETFIEWIRDKYNIFEKNETFEEFKNYVENETPEDFYTGLDISLEEKSKDLLKVITPAKYNNLKRKVEEFYIQLFNTSNKIEIHSKLKEIYEYFSENLTKLSKFLSELEKNIGKEDWFKEQGLDPVDKKEDIYPQIVVLSIEEIFHLWQRYLFYKEVNENKLKETFEILLKIRESDTTPVFTLNNKCEKLIIFFSKILESKLLKGSSLLLEQIELIKKYLQEFFIFIHGYPGTSKTFTGTLAILIDAICKKSTIAKKNPYNAMILAPTYKALEAAAENFFKFLFYFENILERININVNLILPLPSSEIGKNILEKNPLNNQELDYKSFNTKSKLVNINKNFKIFKLTRTDYNNHINEILNQGSINLILDLPIGFIKYGKGQAKIVPDKLNLVHVEEASQFSILDLVIIATQASFFNKLVNSDNDKKRFFKFTFSGDPYQLKSIFNISDETVKYKKVGTLVNLFTFFLKDFEPHKDNRLFVLKKTLRNPPEIIIPIKGVLYKDIESANPDRGEILLKTYSDKEIPSTLKVDGQKINEFEAQLIQEIIENEIKFNNYEKICILTLYRKQENFLRKVLTPFLESQEIVKKYTIGTVDKVQGDTCDLVILSFVSTNPNYIENNYSFILEPARLNVSITRTRKKFIAIMHENVKQLLVSTDLEYLYILLILFEQYKRTFGIEESFEQFLEKYKSWNPNVGGLIFEKLLFSCY